MFGRRRFLRGTETNLLEAGGRSCFGTGRDVLGLEGQSILALGSHSADRQWIEPKSNYQVGLFREELCLHQYGFSTRARKQLRRKKQESKLEPLSGMLCSDRVSRLCKLPIEGGRVPGSLPPPFKLIEVMTILLFMFLQVTPNQLQAFAAVETCHGLETKDFIPGIALAKSSIAVTSEGVKELTGCRSEATRTSAPSAQLTTTWNQEKHHKLMLKSMQVEAIE